MSCRGVYFALTNEQADQLSQAARDSEVINCIEQIEKNWDRDWVFETDKAWDAIHRTLTDGNLGYANGEYPLNQVVLGELQLHEGEEYVVSVIPASKMKDIADALEKISEPLFRKRYLKINRSTYDGVISEEDFSYTWGNFQGLPEFFSLGTFRDRIFRVYFLVCHRSALRVLW